MNKFYRKLYLYCILNIFACSQIYAINYFNQTILVTKAPAQDFFLHEPGWHEVKRDADNKFKCKTHSSFQVVGFYQKLKRESAIATYFGASPTSPTFSYGPSIEVVDTSCLIHDTITNNFKFKIGDTTYIYKRPSDAKIISPDNAIAALVGNVYEYDATTTNFVKKDTTTSKPIVAPYDLKTNISLAAENFDKDLAIPRSLRGKMNLEPKRKLFGMLMSYYGFLKETNFWMQIDIPFLVLKQSLLPTIVHESKFYDSTLGREASIVDILTGKYSFENEGADNPDRQIALKNAKFSLKEMEKSGIGDIKISLGYRLADNTAFDCNGFIEATFPNADEISSEYIFSPQLGNNGHFSIGIGIKGSADIFELPAFSLESIFSFSTNYFFPKDQIRTFGTLTDIGVSLPWDRYYLVAKNNTSNFPLQPMANISTISAKVSPGFSANGSIGLSLKSNWILVSTGYSFCARQSENLEIKSWSDADLFGRPSEDSYRTDQIFSPEDYPFKDLDITTISKKEIYLQSASTPGSFSNTFFLQAGYYGTEYTLKPLNLSVGVAYEFANENSSLSQYSVYAKLGVAF